MLQEAEFQTVASETIRGVTSSNKNVDSRHNRSEKTFFGNAQESEIQKYRPCKVCKGHHGVWRCDKFKYLPVQERCNTAKRLKLCFRCLGGDHRGQTEIFETMPVDVELESLDGSVNKTVSAFTTERVTGNLEAIDWRKHANKWPHLRGIQFPKPGPHPL